MVPNQSPILHVVQGVIENYVRIRTPKAERVDRDAAHAGARPWDTSRRYREVVQVDINDRVYSLEVCLRRDDTFLKNDCYEEGESVNRIHCAGCAKTGRWAYRWI